MSEFTFLQFFRLLLYVILVLLLSQLGQTGINIFALLGGIGLSIYLAGKFLNKKISFKKTVLIHIVVFFLLFLLSTLANWLYLNFSPSGNEFLFSNPVSYTHLTLPTICSV